MTFKRPVAPWLHQFFIFLNFFSRTRSSESTIQALVDEYVDRPYSPWVQNSCVKGQSRKRSDEDSNEKSELLLRIPFDSWTKKLSACYMTLRAASKLDLFSKQLSCISYLDSRPRAHVGSHLSSRVSYEPSWPVVGETHRQCVQLVILLLLVSHCLKRFLSPPCKLSCSYCWSIWSV